MTAPLHGITVLDFSPLLPGPFASRMLADMGARVIRIESPTRADMVRTVPPFVEGVSALHAYLNRNKQQVALDLKSEAGVQAARALAENADVVIEQFRPGVMDRLGLGYATLSEGNPRLVYCSITGYGQDGPLRDRAGHDINYLALSGLAGSSGRRAGGPPPLGFQAADLGGGSLHAVIGILAALRQRDLDGVGQHIDISMTDCAFHLNPLAAVSCLAGGESAGPESGMLDGGGHYDYYRTADERWLAVGSLEPAFLKALCEAVGDPGLVARFASSPQEAKAALANALASRTQAEWQAIFSGVDACV
ncbi:MAG: CoA transferase, partial [Burkholderiales bacterium]|nr:CoA transferase [Burkholderiales bacterium]